MKIIKKIIDEVEKTTNECGLSEGPVFLEEIEGAPLCAYESGKLMKVSFGGRSATVATKTPYNATTKPSFMFNAPLSKEPQIAAAIGITNVIAAFLCRIRKPYPCEPEEHIHCHDCLKAELSGKKIWYIGENAEIIKAIEQKADSPEQSDIILVTIDKISTEEMEKIPEALKNKIIMVGPSLAGSANILENNHFCPYARGNI